MDNFKEAGNDNLAVGEIAETAINIGKNIQQKAILKKAKKLIAAGKANQCTGRMIDICLENGIDPKVFENNPVYMARPSVIQAKAAAIKQAGVTVSDEKAIEAAQTEAVNTKKAVDSKNFLPYILGAVGLILVIYLISKK